LRNLFLALTLALLGSASHASGYLTGLNGPGVTISKYFVHRGGGVSIFLNDDLLNPDGCTFPRHVYIKGDSEGHKLMVSTALTAFISGKAIGLHGFGCEIIPFWGGTITVPTISELWMFY